MPLSALSIGLGLGLQNLASNYIAGLVLMTEGTIRDGDMIEVDGIRGTVQEMSLRTTVVKTFSNTDVIVPNSLMVSQRLDNWTKSDQILRIESQIGVAYGSEIGVVHNILHSHIVKHTAVLSDPEPRTFFGRIRRFGAAIPDSILDRRSIATAFLTQRDPGRYLSWSAGAGHFDSFPATRCVAEGRSLLARIFPTPQQRSPNSGRNVHPL